MTSTETTTPGAPVWIDLATSDPDASIAFYTGAFGWTVEAMGEYWGFYNGTTMVAGLGKNSPESGRPDGWLVYLLSLDVDSTSLAAHSNGGDVLSRHGEMIVVKDSQGALVGAWNPSDHKTHVYSREVGAPTWHELHAADYDSALEFYANVFEWEATPMPDAPPGMRYSTLGEGDDALAGIFDAKDDLGDAATRWEIYFQVADADATAATIAELGGTMIDQPVDTPFGRMAHAKDAAGSPFTIIQN
jgi:predicted enzyme related to lactoylglutathione lyase